MSNILEEFAKEERENFREEVVITLLKDGTLSISKISKVCKMPEDKVKELAEKLKINI